MSHPLDTLDGGKATLRLVLCLAEECPSHSMTELRSCMRKYGVGGTALSNSLRRLRDLGLTRDETRGSGARREKVTRLTEKGLELAEKISELYELLY